MKRFLTFCFLAGIITSTYCYENNNILSDGNLDIRFNDLNTKSDMSIDYSTKLKNGNPLSFILATDTENDDDCAYIDIRFPGEEFDLGMTLSTATDNSQAIYVAYSGFKIGFNFGHEAGGVSYYGDFDINDSEPDNFFISLDGQLEWFFGKENRDLKFVADYNGSAFSFGVKYLLENNMTITLMKNNGGDYLDVLNNNDYDYTFSFSKKLDR